MEGSPAAVADSGAGDADDWRAWGDHELLKSSLSQNPFLAGLVERWGAEQVNDACLRSSELGYPASMVGTHAEARAIQEFLTTHSVT